MALDFGRGWCDTLAVAGRREWLVTNGLGGYAAGTVAGPLTRRYHGLLIAALQPPLGRTLLLTRLDETVDYDGQTYALFANGWQGGLIEPEGFRWLERFRLEGTTPVWSYACADALLEKRVWMQPGANTTYIRFDLPRASRPLTLALKTLVNYRDYHGVTRAGDWRMQIEPVAGGLRVLAFEGATPLYLLSATAAAVPAHDWYRAYDLPLERERGLEASEDHLHAGTFRATMRAGQSLTLVASTTPAPDLDGQRAHGLRRAHEQALLARAGAWPGSGPLSASAASGRGDARCLWRRGSPPVAGRRGAEPAPGDAGASGLPALARQLVLAADQFIVTRPLPDGTPGASVIAGYPWFGDWGRDTMLALPGLTLATGRPEVAAGILRTFACFMDQGLLPNRFPDAGAAPEYNSADATLWFIEAARAYVAATDDLALAAELLPLLADAIAWHQRGTRHGIRVDPADGLLAAGEPGQQVTWMDARVGERVVTPRTGKPVEINALWYNALRAVADLASRLGAPSSAYVAAAERAAVGFGRFWYAGGRFLYDVLDGPGGPDASLRPNQLLAVALPYSPLPAEQQRAVVECCARQLLTSVGLRSLAPGDPAYAGHYAGPPAARDAVYHQGPAWSWLIGPFVSAQLRVYGDPAAARTYLVPLLHHLADGCIGQVSELFDGDAPFSPRGCFAQAWGVAELLRAWRATVA